MRGNALVPAGIAQAPSTRPGTVHRMQMLTRSLPTASLVAATTCPRRLVFPPLDL